MVTWPCPSAFVFTTSVCLFEFLNSNFFVVQVLSKSTSLAFATTCLVAPHKDKDAREPSSSQEVDSRISAIASTLTQQLLLIRQDAGETLYEDLCDTS